MESRPISYKKIINIVKDLINFLGEMDDKIANTQKNYNQKVNTMNKEYNLRNEKFEKNCRNAIDNLQKNSKSMLSEANKIQKQIIEMDKKLSSVDKYYVKTKNKKLNELENKKSDKFSDNTDYFEILKRIKEKFEITSKKYSEEMLPSILNGLNYLFSSKRKKDYEELIILQNTVNSFIKEMENNLNLATEETISEMRSNYSTQRNEMENSQREFKEKQETAYMESLNNISEEIEKRLDALLPDELIKELAITIEEYNKSYMKVNSTNKVDNGLFYIGYIDFPVRDFVQSNTLLSFVLEKCKPVIVDSKIRLPLILSINEGFDIFIEKSVDGKINLQQMIQGIMFSFLSSIPIMGITFNVIDCENHGNSVLPYFDVKKKIPELFGEKLYTNKDEAIKRLYELNEKVDTISQEILGTEYNNIFEYKEENSEYMCNVEVLTLFDFPYDLDEQALSCLKNIIIYGKRCGVYVIIAGQSKTDSNYASQGLIDGINQIINNCVYLTQTTNGFEYATLPYISSSMPVKTDLGNFVSKYILVNEGMKNKGIALPQNVRKLMESKTDEELEKNITDIKNIIEEYNERFGTCPEESAGYMKMIPIGLTHYPLDLFMDSYGFERIQEEFKDRTGKIKLPLFMNCETSCNFLTIYSETNRNRMISFANNILMSLFSMFPVSKFDTYIVDCEQQGSSIKKFLDFKNECPAVFNDEIYTNKENLTKCLEKLNSKIDDIIQNKLANRYKNILEYNKNNPNRTEICSLLIIYDFPAGIDSRNNELLINILKNGGKCGIYTLLGYNKDVALSTYGSIDKVIEKINQYTSSIEISEKNYSIIPFNLPISIKEEISNEEISQFIKDYKEISNKLKGKGFSFDNILDEKLFSRDTDKELSIPIGIGDGESKVPIVFGKGSSHHALVAGATGSGKSTLLHTLIMSAMLHYTPDKLNLYLMDFKGGTEFKIYDSYRLPHIKLLALDAMQEFGESILEDLVAEIERRSLTFKSVNASKLSEYVKLSGQAMPKILVIMDEFQILFNDSTNRKVANHCAELTKRIVTEGRSYGIHLLMATQSTKIISELSLDSGTLEQMRIRVGLKCGEYDARYLFTDKNDTKALEMMKGPIGTAVLNEEYTEQENIGLRVAYCDDKTQEKYLNLIVETFSDYEYNMQTFEGSKTEDLLSVLPSNISNTLPLEIKVGPLIKVADPLTAIFDKKRKHNTLICGANEKMNDNLTNLYALGTLLNSQTKVYFIDGDVILEGRIPENTYYDEFMKFNDRFKMAVTRTNIIEFVKEVYDYYLDSKKYMSDKQIVVFIKNFQYLDVLKKMLKGERVNESEYIEKDNSDAEEIKNDDPFGFGFGSNSGSSNNDNISEKLMKLIDDGSAYGINFIVTSLEYPSVKECLHYGDNVLSKFPERYVFAISDNDADSLIDGISLKSLKDNTVYYTDSLKNTFQVKPYVFPKKKELEEYIEKII